MASAALKQTRLSYEEYLELEERSDERHFYWDGEIFAMSGASPRHYEVEANLVIQIHLALQGRPCRPYTGNVRLRSLDLEGRSAYPDAVVVCGRLQTHPDDGHAVTNPTVVFEVLSSSTERFDRGDKFAWYRSFDTLRSYVLVSQERVAVEHFHREGDLWTLRILGPGDLLTLPDLGVSVPVDAFYEGVDWETAEATD